ncbi:MAG: hypothetical protein JWN63_3506 [Candidatus Acidoferrum typicum]|nr:hypothetical protein [Candidatus Acidoferrum typicum]
MGDGGASGGRGNAARRGSERFDGTRKIQGLRQFDRRFDRGRRGDGYGWGQHEGNRTNQRAVRIVTARHGAGHHSGHVMPAIHVIRGRGGSFLVMVRGNRALTGRAAGGLIGRPCGSRERRIEQNDHEQTDACGNRTAAIVTRSLHIVWGPISIVTYYSVKRHSFQALLKMAATVSFTQVSP